MAREGRGLTLVEDIEVRLAEAGLEVVLRRLLQQWITDHKRGLAKMRTLKKMQKPKN